MGTSKIRGALAAGATAVLIALAAAGCGSGGDDGTAATTTTTVSPAAAYAPLKVQILALGSDIGAAVDRASRSSDAQVARRFRSLADRTTETVAAIDQLQVPENVRADAEALRDALRKGGDDLAEISTAARAHDSQAAEQAARKLVADSETIQRARARFEAAIRAGDGGGDTGGS